MRHFIVPFAAALFAVAVIAVAPVAAHTQASVPGDTALITSWYQRYLGRNPDSPWLQIWAQELRRGRNVEAAILASDEYLKRHSSTADGFVTGLYVDVLSRQPRPDEVQGWLTRLQQVGNNRETLASDFLVAAQAELATRAAVPPPIPVPPPETLGTPEPGVYRSILPLPFGFRFGWWR